jgi:hypothetical protein
MPDIAKKSGIWAFLDASGVLEKGTEDEIKAAKKEYRKQYLLNYKRKQRTSKPEFAVCFSKDNGEYSKILSAAKKHKSTIPAFLKLATHAYISKTYIVPDRLLIAKLEQLLSQCLNEIQLIVRQKEKYFWGKEEKFKVIENRIAKLESELNELFYKPFTLEECIIREIHNNPEIKNQILSIISSIQNDH